MYFDVTFLHELCIGCFYVFLSVFNLFEFVKVMIRVTCLRLGSGVVFYCWKITSLELRVSFQMHLSLEFLASTMENIPQDHDIWSKLLSLATRLLSTPHFTPSGPMVRGHHSRLALRMDRRLGNAPYPPRTLVDSSKSNSLVEEFFWS